MSASHWMCTADPPLDPASISRAAARAGGSRSTGDPVECDLCVVGGGICGISAALHAQRRGLRVEVLERGAVAVGASGRNAGFLMRGAADHYADAVRIYGRTRAAFVWRWTEENLRGLRAEGIEHLPGYRRIPSCLLALSKPQADDLRASHDLLIADGFESEWIEGASIAQSDRADTLWRHAGPVAGLENPNDGSAHPIELVRMLASKLERPVREGCEVESIAVEGGAARAACANGAEVRAPRVLLATNAYAGLLCEDLRGGVVPRRGQMLALRGEGITLARSYYLNHGSEYVRQAADGTVLVGGCRTYFADRETGYDDEPTAWTQGALEAFAANTLGLRTIDGVRERVIARWAGTMGFSESGLPIITPVREGAGSLPIEGASGASGSDQSVWFCGGFTGHGMSMGFKTAQAAVGVVCFGEENPFPA
ncbi:MAG: FAD-binding oxidoreductase [Phycisphaeraceae bacterium]|nr:FAD-binding oxidoreductase [Phycisphaeraceae bacterium]